MSAWKRYSLMAIAVMVTIVFLLSDQINRFLFHPEGLSTAASEVCVTNQAGLTVVAQISIAGGANSLTLLDDADEACSPAPGDGLPAEIRFSVEDGKGPFCTLETVSGQEHTLLVFDAPDNCEWAEE